MSGRTRVHLMIDSVIVRISNMATSSHMHCAKLVVANESGHGRMADLLCGLCDAGG